MPNPTGRVVSVNVGVPRDVEIQGRPTRTAIVKTPVEGRRRVEGVTVEGDAQANLEAHGGPTKSVYVYGAADYDWWSARLGRDLTPGTFGENLTVEGIDPSDARVGETWRVGTAVLVATEPRIPCAKLGWRMDDPRFPARFAAAGRPGSYFGIVEAGDVAAGDEVEVLDRPDHDVTVGLVERAFHEDKGLAPRLLAAPELTPGWREWAEKMVATADLRR